MVSRLAWFLALLAAGLALLLTTPERAAGPRSDAGSKPPPPSLTRPLDPAPELTTAGGQGGT